MFGLKLLIVILITALRICSFSPIFTCACALHAFVLPLDNLQNTAMREQTKLTIIFWLFKA